MIKCECGGTEFEVTMVTLSTVRVTTESGQPKQISGTKKEQPIEFNGSFVCVKCRKSYSETDIVKASEDSGQRRCICGNMRFTATQICYHDIIVDGYNNFQRDTGIGESEKPYGPYRYIECNAEYETLDKLDEK